MKRIFPARADDSDSGIAFEVEDDSKCGTNMYLADVLRIFRCAVTEETWPTAVIQGKNGPRKMTSLGPWYFCSGCKLVIIESEQREAMSMGLSGRRYCSTCAAMIKRDFRAVIRRKEDDKRRKNAGPIARLVEGVGTGGA